MIPKDNKCRYLFLNGKLFDAAKDFTDIDFERNGVVRIYEVVHVTDSVPVFLRGHYARLENSSRLTGVKGYPSYEEISDNVKSLLQLNCETDCNFKLICTDNGKGSCDKILYFNKYNIPDCCVWGKKEGIAATVFEWERVSPNAKVGRNDYISAVNECKKNHPESFELILKNREGKLTEGSMSNFFGIKNGKVYTAPKKDVLEGIMRKYIIGICKNLNIPVVYRAPSEKALKEEFDAAFISSTPVNILPLRSLDGQPLNSLNNPVLLNIMHEFDILIKDQSM